MTRGSLGKLLSLGSEGDRAGRAQEGVGCSLQEKGPSQRGWGLCTAASECLLLKGSCLLFSNAGWDPPLETDDQEAILSQVPSVG